MSFDLGPQDGMTSDEDFAHLYLSLLDEYDMRFSELCTQAGIDESTANDAIQRGLLGLPNDMEIHQRLLHVVGLDVSYLLAPRSTGLSTEIQRGSRGVPTSDDRRKLRTLSWNFAARDEIPQKHRRPLANYVVSLLEARPRNTMRLAARASVPRTMIDMAHLYARLLKDGFFTKE